MSGVGNHLANSELHQLDQIVFGVTAANRHHAHLRVGTVQLRSDTARPHRIVEIQKQNATAGNLFEPFQIGKIWIIRHCPYAFRQRAGGQRGFHLIVYLPIGGNDHRDTIVVTHLAPSPAVPVCVLPESALCEPVLCSYRLETKKLEESA